MNETQAKNIIDIDDKIYRLKLFLLEPREPEIKEAIELKIAGFTKQKIEIYDSSSRT